MYEFKLIVSVLHWAAVGTKEAVVAAAVGKFHAATVLPDLIYSDVQVVPQSVVIKTSKPSI